MRQDFTRIDVLNTELEPIDLVVSMQARPSEAAR
jgi:hypothetical protein